MSQSADAVALPRPEPPKQFEPFGPLDNIEKPVARTLWYSVYEGALTTLFLTWTSGMVLTGYMIHLGATPFQLAMVASIPLLAQAGSPLSAWLLSLYPRPKRLTTMLALVGRAVWIVAAMLPLLSLPKEKLPSILIFVMVFSYLFQSACGTIWSVWIGDVVPAERRGRYFGFRGGLLSVVGLCASLSAGIFLDNVAAPFSFVVVLMVGVAMALGGIYMYGMHYEPPYGGRRLRLKEIIRIPLADEGFRHFLRFFAYWQFVVLLAATFVFPYFLDHLKLSFAQVAIYQCIAAITTLVLAPFWGKVADKVGNKAILVITTFIAGSALPLTWILATPGDPTMIYISGVVDGVAWSAIGPAIFNLSLATTPKETRIAYLAALNFSSGITGFIGGLLSAPLLEMFRHIEFILWGMQWTAFHWLFLLSAILRTQAWRLIGPIKETQAWRTRDVLRAARSYRFIGFFWR